MRAARAFRSLRSDDRGVSTIEFALMIPLFFLCGGSALEYVHFGLAHLNVSQIASSLADNASRVGLTNTLNVTQLREVDINDVLTASRLQGNGIQLTTHGRITLSSLENIQQSYDKSPVQRIHWQRCIGLMSGSGFDSSFGSVSKLDGSNNNKPMAGTTMTDGMGPTGRKVNAPAGAGVMFVEVNYQYQPLFGSLFIQPSVIQYVSSFIVRDNRDFSQVYNPSPTAERYSCDQYTDT